MVTRKKDEKAPNGRITLFAAINEDQYDALKYLTYKKKKSLAEITREAIDVYLSTVEKESA
ncbi:MAG: hypothetical protein HQK88_14910 [Nitrospirae bacterium]|nr:hypothetical protein [Nitrospirota bacterium]MBF0618090.1 hypothetical protein [Nitrospirota bacterium]